MWHNKFDFICLLSLCELLILKEQINSIFLRFSERLIYIA
jgi:hypothetical protein